MRNGLTQLLLLLLASSTQGFTPLSVASSTRPSTQLHAIDPTDVDQSRIAFFVWFFGSSGAAGIARSAFPRMYNQVRTINSLKGVGPTKGGPTVGLSPLAGYPQDICEADLMAIASNRLSVSQMVKKFPVEGNFLSAKGYLTFTAFSEANKGMNPLAVRAVFDTFATSTDVVEPEKAQSLLDEYKQNTSAFSNNLVKSKLLGFSSIFTLLFLLGFADYIAAGHAYHGWFPEWPGAEDFPAYIFDKEKGLSTIPNYWLDEY